MADTKISAATLTTPEPTDLFPFERPGSAVARYASGAAIYQAGYSSNSTAINVNNIGADPTGATDSAAAINAAITAGLQDAWGTSGSEQTLHGRVRLNFSPGGVYRIDSPINLCNMQGVTLDGGVCGYGAIIYGKCAGKAMLEVIGSAEIGIENIQLVGDQTNTPACAVFVSRSSVSTNSTNINFWNMRCDGYFTKAAIYSLESEDNHFYNCKFLTDGGAATGVVCIARTNIHSLLPDNATLAGTGYAPYNIYFFNCHLVAAGGNPARVMYIHEGEVSALNTYFYTAGQPAIEWVGGYTGELFLDHCFVEGAITKGIQLTYLAGSTNNFIMDIRRMDWGTPTGGYLIYADDNTSINDSVVWYSPPPGDTTARNSRFYNAYGSDFRGLSNWSTNSANTITIANESAACKFRLVNNEVLTVSGTDYGSIIERYGALAGGISGIADNTSAAATSLGNVARKIAIYDKAGNVTGYIPLYDAIT